MAPEPLQRPLVRWLAAVAIAIGLASFVGLPAKATYGARTSGDEPQYLLTAISIGDDFNLDISDEIDAEEYKPFHEIPIATQTIIQGDTSIQISPHDPLLPILLAGPMLIGGWIGAKLALVAIATATGVVTVLVGYHHLKVSLPVAVLIVTWCFMGLPLSGYGAQVYPEMAAALVTVTLFGLACSAADNPRVHTLAGMTAMVFILPWLSIKYVPIAAVGGLALIWSVRHHRHLMLFFVALGVAGTAVYLGTHQHLYGGWTAYASGDHFVDDGEFSVIGTRVNLVGRSRRVIGLLVDKTFGIGVWSPLWLLLPVAMRQAWKSNTAQNHLAVSVVALGWINATFVALTMHGWWLPGRQLVAVLPLAAIVVAQWVDADKRRLWLATPLGVMGATNWMWLALESSTGHRTLIVDFYETQAAAYRLLSPIMPDGIAATTQDTALLALWTLAAGVGLVGCNWKRLG